MGCDLCPRRCGADRVHGKRGACGASADILVARASLHEWEEPPISGSVGSGTIFFSHCTLHCLYCQNRVIAHGCMGKPMGVDDIVAACLRLQDEGAMNINFVTPTHYGDTVREVVRRARAQGLHVPIVWNTSGYETVQTIRDNGDIVDVYLTDMKYADPRLGERYSGVADYPGVALAAIDEMVRLMGAPEYDIYHGDERMRRGIIVRHLLLPGHLDDSKAVVQLMHERYGDRIKISLMNQYTPLLRRLAAEGDAAAAADLARYPYLGETVSGAEYEELLDFADDIGVQDYFWQDGATASESFIPNFSNSVVLPEDRMN